MSRLLAFRSPHGGVSRRTLPQYYSRREWTGLGRRLAIIASTEGPTVRRLVDLVRELIERLERRGHLPPA